MSHQTSLKTSYQLESEHHITDSYPSDCESGISSPSEPDHQISQLPNTKGLIKLHESETMYQAIKKRLQTINVAGVENIHRKDYIASGVMSRAKFQSFSVYAKATQIKCGGNANVVKYAWYGAKSKAEIRTILDHGFGVGVRHGISLSPIDHPLESVRASGIDEEDGMRHMLLCRVILGKTEIVCPCSGQCNPSSDEFDSGVDDLTSPRKYIVWNSRMNTHILPEFVVTFRRGEDCIVAGDQRSLQSPQRKTPQSDWMPFASLINALSKFLPRDATELIAKYHCDFKNRMITREEMIQQVRHIAGDNLLTAIIKSFRGKMKATSRSSSLNKRRN